MEEKYRCWNFGEKNITIKYRRNINIIYSIRKKKNYDITRTPLIKKTGTDTHTQTRVGAIFNFLNYNVAVISSRDRIGRTGGLNFQEKWIYISVCKSVRWLYRYFRERVHKNLISMREKNPFLWAIHTERRSYGCEELQ